MGSIVTELQTQGIIFEGTKMFRYVGFINYGVARKHGNERTGIKQNNGV